MHGMKRDRDDFDPMGGASKRAYSGSQHMPGMPQQGMGGYPGMPQPPPGLVNYMPGLMPQQGGGMPHQMSMGHQLGMLAPAGPDLNQLLGASPGGAAGTSAAQVLQLVQLMANPQVAAALGVAAQPPPAQQAQPLLQQQTAPGMSLGMNMPQPSHAGSIPGPGPLPGPPGSLLPPADRPPFEIPPNATDTIYVDNLPKDVTQRELSHIFRPFRGFKAVRIIERDGKDNAKIHLGFAEFDNPVNCTIALRTVDRYAINYEEPDRDQLQLTYAKGSLRPRKGAKDERRDYRRR